jgi:SAM-dependent methyltransferase
VVGDERGAGVVSNGEGDQMRNLQSHLQSLNLMMGSVKGHETKIIWLLDLNEKYDSIVNFGCNIGFETLALMWLLTAREAVGVDKDGSHIDQARSLHRDIQQDIQSIQMALLYNRDLPSEFRSELQSYVEDLKNLPFPTFVEGDMTKTTGLPSDHFDLAYCERVLYHIRCDKSRRAEDNVLSAIQEMVRVVKPGALVVAIEPNTCSPDDNATVELRPSFERFGLSPFKLENRAILAENETLYVYSKLK